MDAFGSMDNDASPGLRFGENDADDSLSFVTFALVEIEMAASKVCRLAEGEPFGDSRHLFELWLLFVAASFSACTLAAASFSACI